MNEYTYSLRDYHAVKEASIKLEGITVLTGVNGAGKSTLSKWLYYLVNGANSYDRYIYARFVAALRDRVWELDRRRRDVDGGSLLEARMNNMRFFQEAVNRMVVLEHNGEDIQELVDVYERVIQRFGGILEIYLAEHNKSTARSERVLKFLGFEDEMVDDVKMVLQTFYKKEQTAIEKLQKKYLIDKERRSRDTFFSVLHREFDIADEQPHFIQLEENGVKLLDNGNVGHLYNLTQAIYIDTPMALLGKSDIDDNIFWQDLNQFVLDDRENYELTENARKILKRITKLLHGKTVVADDDFGQKEVHFVREDGLDIKVQDAATGVKSFSYIQRLVENGYLDDKTLLMIDEPEAHLHPQWIIEFARILVLLNKSLGVKILIASHNPHMVAALQAIANKEQVIDRLHCYLAEKSTDYMFSYVDQKYNIEQIFKSFNMAYDKIDEYGIGL